VSAQITVRAPAKVNLSLGVGPVRADGYHPLATVYQAIGLFDDVTVRDADGWTLTVEGHERITVADVPADESNIAVRAALLLAAHHRRQPDVAIDIHKGIPVAGGLAGGSADAAGALLACDMLWGTHTPRPDLMALAAELGSDVPFALVGGTAIGGGRGEHVTPLPTLGQVWWVVLESEDGLSTPAVYREFDAMHADAVVHQPEIPSALVEALHDHDVEKLGAALVNDLQAPALRLRPELAVALDKGIAASAYGSLISGSGPSLLFLCDSRPHAARVAASLRELHNGSVSCAPGPVPGAHVVG
jgi:4-diphosphocytidyl-2-C-methyl-D-erythritol kinase